MQNITNEKPQKKLTARLNASVNFVDTNDITNKTILDIGCGYGWFEMYALRQNAKQIYACEVSESDLSTIRNNVVDQKLQIQVGDATKLTFQNETFDTLVCWEVIEHIPVDTEDMLFSEAARVLKPNGVLYLSTPFDSIPAKIFDPAWWLTGHRHYNLNKLNEFALKHSFIIEKSTVFGGWWLILDILNMYISKWLFHRKRFFSAVFDQHVNNEYTKPNGFVNIFVKFKKMHNA